MGEVLILFLLPKWKIETKVSLMSLPVMAFGRVPNEIRAAKILPLLFEELQRESYSEGCLVISILNLNSNKLIKMCLTYNECVYIRTRK